MNIPIKMNKDFERALSTIDAKYGEDFEILNGFTNTDSELLKMAKTFNANKFQTLIKIVIPANISTFINSLKVNIGLSLVGVISGEFLVSKAGLRIFNCIWRSSI